MDQETTSLHDFIEKFLDYFGLTAELRSEVTQTPRGKVINFDLSGDDLGALIGYHGQVLNAWQLILNLLAGRDRRESGESSAKVVVDVNGYRKERAEFLIKLANQTADRVRFLQTQIVLSPMSSFERYIIHDALSGSDSVVTESIGEGSARRVVVKPAGGQG